MSAIAKSILHSYYLSQPVLSAMQMAIFFTGSMFWVEATLSGQAFSARVFGDFALQFNAEVWAGWMMAGAAITWMGLRHPVKWWMIAVGAGLQTLQYLALGYSAIMTGGEMVIGLHCTVFFAPLYARIFWEAVTSDAG